jgi:copper chaperone CopZ
MKKEGISVGGAVLAALGASLCCIGPLLFALLGLGAFGAANVFESLRPFLLGVAILALAFGFYRTYFRKQTDSSQHARCCATDQACATKPAGRAGRVGLWLATVLVLAFALSPYYIGYIAAAFVRRQPPMEKAQPVTESAGDTHPKALDTATIKVEGMTCTSCEAPVQAALEKTPGVRVAEVSYNRGEARIQYDPRQTDLNQLRRAINSTGYKAKE